VTREDLRRSSTFGSRTIESEEWVTRSGDSASSQSFPILVLGSLKAGEVFISPTRTTLSPLLVSEQRSQEQVSGAYGREDAFQFCNSCNSCNS
jgi:hypothetical protein